MKFLKMGICSYLFAMAIAAHAQLVPSDLPYSVIEKNRYHYILSHESFDFISQAIKMNEDLRELYQPSFAWTLEERASLVLASRQNQIANGFATVTPNTLTFFYPSGFPLIDTFASPNWYSVLLAHESAHLYQLDAKGPLSSLLRKFVGNPLFVITPIVPVFIHPNQFAPSFLMEGNAVLNESAHGIGGRLHSGEVRALVLNQINQGTITIEHLINDHLHFPFFTEKYLVGGYFFAFLAQKYGLDQANSFFVHQGQHAINPLIVNNTFRSHFGESYGQILREFLLFHQEAAKAQRAAAGEILFRSLSLGPMNADQDKIWFLVQKDLKSPPRLVNMNKADRKWNSDQLDLPMGKVFWHENEPAVATSLQHNARQIENSLYGEGLRFLPEFRSTIPQENRVGVWAAIEGSSQFQENRLLVNGEPFASVHSSVVLSAQGQPIFFKQDLSERVLLKGTEELVRYNGFYGKPMEETSRGGITFVASTSRGSSLFEFFSGEIYRLTESDLVVDAREIGPSQFLIAEVTAHGYEYKVIEAQPVAERPGVYEYPWAFTNSPLAEQTKRLSMPEKTSEEALSPRPYSAVRDLRYSYADVSLGYSSISGPIGFVSANFVDPLFYNFLNLQLQNFSDSNGAGVQYAYSRYLIQPFIGYSFFQEEDLIFRNGKFEEENEYEHRAFVGFSSPFWKWRRMSANWTSQAAYQHIDFANRKYEEETELTHRLGVDYSQSYGLSYLPYRYHSLTLLQQSLFANHGVNAQDSILMGALQISGDVGWENFLNLRYTEAFAESENIRLTFAPGFASELVRVGRLYPATSVDVKSLRSVSLSYRRPFETPLYYARFPLSFRRTALAADVAYYDVDSSELSRGDFQDSFIGLEIEALLIHRLPLRLTLGSQRTTETDQSASLLLQFHSKAEF